MHTGLIKLRTRLPKYTHDGKRPLSIITRRQPPKFSDLKKITPNTSKRQRWFERILRLISAEYDGESIPWRFETADGEELQLDQGAVGFAFANGILISPIGDEVLWTIKLANYREHARLEIQRLRRVGEIARRPAQPKFSAAVRRNYGEKCAVTGCTTASALQAAHIKVPLRLSRDFERFDDNHESNGILLRSDIHALLDAYLITLTPDGRKIELSERLSDKTYDFLRHATIRIPEHGPSPSSENINYHRRRFLRKNQKPCRS